jgi:cytidylate kinase
MQQRRIGEQGNIVMVGRDIGTVVLPDADIKIFLDASIEERARRRFEELIHRGEPASLEAVLYSMQRRDEIDSTRDVAPLKPADDAIRVSSDGKTVDEVVQIIIDLVKQHP